jgi:hypothetical protein
MCSETYKAQRWTASIIRSNNSNDTGYRLDDDSGDYGSTIKAQETADAFAESKTRTAALMPKSGDSSKMFFFQPYSHLC